MATDRLRYVNPASTGGDGTTNATSGASAAYASIHAALTAEYALNPNLVTADLRLILECEGTDADGQNIGFSSYQFTTDDTRYVLVRCQGASRHEGVYSTSHFRYVPSSVNGVLGFNQIACHLEVEGLQVNMTAGLANNPIAFSLLNGNAHLRLRDCIIKASGTGTPTGSAAIYGTGVDARRVYMSNCLIEGPFYQGVQINFLSGAGRLVVHHCTFVGLYKNGIVATDGGSGRVSLRNNRVDTLVSPGVSFNTTGTTEATGGNFTADANSPDDATHENKTFVWAGGGSYLLASDDGFEGADLSADAFLPVTTDVLGTTRTQFHAGFHEFAAGGPSYVDLEGVLLQSDLLSAGGGGDGAPGGNLIGGGLVR